MDARAYNADKVLYMILNLSRSHQWVYVLFVKALQEEGNMELAKVLSYDVDDKSLLPVTRAQCDQLQQCTAKITTEAQNATQMQKLFAILIRERMLDSYLQEKVWHSVISQF